MVNSYSNSRCRFVVAFGLIGLFCLIMGIKAFHSHSLKLAIGGEEHPVSVVSPDQGCSICDFNFGPDACTDPGARISLISPTSTVYNLFIAQTIPAYDARLALTRGPPLS